MQGFSQAYGANLREGYQQIRRSPFLRWMALSTLSMTILLVLLNYGASAIFQAELQTTVAISDFLGVLSGVANLVILPFQLFLLSRLITRLGLGNASLVYPLASLAAAGGLAVAPGLGTAALAYLDRTALRTAFRIPTDNLFYNAVPLRVKARTRAFVSGLVDDCIARGKDVGEGGPHYNAVGGGGIGLANACDSLLAIKKAVFDEKMFTCPDNQVLQDTVICRRKGIDLTATNALSPIKSQILILNY